MYDYKAIIAILESQSSLLDWGAEESRIKNLVAHGVARAANKQYLEEICGEEIAVRNGIGKVPSDLFRLLRVTDRRFCQIDYGIAGVNIKPKHIIDGYICIDYCRLPLENGLPVVAEYHLDYIVAFVKKSMLWDMYMKGDITENAWQRIENAAAGSFRKAKQGRVTMDEMAKAIWMMRNGTRYNDVGIIR